jgi:hypothetical protein
MSEREALLASVADTIKTYREGELPAPTPKHVETWLSQFTSAMQLPFLREFDYVIKETFFTRAKMLNFLNRIITNSKLVGSNPKAYWSAANFHKEQDHGSSQAEMLKLFSMCLDKAYRLKLDDCGSNDGDYIYLDDFMFTGFLAGNDLEPWIKNSAPRVATVQTIVAAYHTSGKYSYDKRLRRAISETGKRISIEYGPAREIENRRYKRDVSQVLWPMVIPDGCEVSEFMQQLAEDEFYLRRPSANSCWPFSSEAGRQILESEFFIAGAKILAKCQNKKPSMRPLGYNSRGVGFGSLLVTYRNCPNNCPLALWWGNPENMTGALDWYPLLARRGNARNWN